MNDFDLERLARVWQEEPPKEEIASMEQSAMRARRRGRAAQWLDAASAGAVAIVVIVLVSISPTLETLLAGGGALVVLLLSQRRQRQLRAIELRSLTGSTEEMLAQSTARTRAALKRNWFSLIGMGPATLLGWLVALYASRRSLRSIFEGPIEVTRFNALVLLLLVAVFIYLATSIRRDRKELRRLQALRLTYRREKDSSHGEAEGDD